jgi:hypothetical protein
MNVKIRKTNKDGMVRLETTGDIKEVMINENFMQPNDESVAIGFRGKDSSGLIEFKVKEIEHLYNTIQARTHLIKGLKVVRHIQ